MKNGMAIQCEFYTVYKRKCHLMEDSNTLRCRFEDHLKRRIFIRCETLQPPNEVLYLCHLVLFHKVLPRRFLIVV